MKRFNINTKKVYQKDGEEKVAWNKVGSLVYFPADGDKKAGFKLELNMFPDTAFFVFEDVPREDKISTPF